jgi:ABC-type sugar transport system ATPase subunit
MTMADKIVVLNAGRVEQYGSPLELYERPANLFVAGFIGSPKMNFVSGEAAGEPGVATLGVRPEHLKIGKQGEGWSGDRLGRRASRQRHLPLCRRRQARNVDGALHRRIQPESRRRVWLFRIQRACTASTRTERSSGGKQEEQEMYLEKFKLNGKTRRRNRRGQGIGLACAEALAKQGRKS